MKILYIDFGNVVADDNMYQYYGDLFRELKLLTQIYLLQGIPANINEILSQIEGGVDCIIFGLGYFAQSDQRFFNKIEGLDTLEVPVICMIHKPQTMLDKKVTSTEIAKLLGTSTTMIDKHYTANMRFDNLIEVMNKVDRVKSTTKRHLRIVK